MKKLSVWLLTLALLLLLAGCGKSEAVKSAEGLINAIGEVTLDSNSAILKAENAVAALSEEDMADLEGAETLQAARDSYDALVIIDLIDNMGEVTLSSEDTLQAIRERYDAASPEAQAAVTNYAVLQEAERQYQTLADAAAEALRIAGEDALGRMRLEEDKVRDAVFYYPQHFPKYIDDRTYALCYVGQDDTSVWMRIRYDYVGRDWVFWQQLYYQIDGETDSRTFNYFDIERDNEGYLVWEYIDYTAQAADLRLFAAIAESDEALIRFQGDGGKQYDLTVSQADKDAIRDALALYMYLRSAQ